MVYAKIKFMESRQQLVKRNKENVAVTCQKDELFEVDVLEENGRNAAFRFMVVPEGSEFQVGDIAEVNTAILSVNMGSYWEHKVAKAELVEEN